MQTALRDAGSFLPLASSEEGGNCGGSLPYSVLNGAGTELQPPEELGKSHLEETGETNTGQGQRQDLREVSYKYNLDLRSSDPFLGLLQ